MDFLFLNHSASVEAIIVFLSLGIIFLFLFYDFVIWIQRKYREMHPRKSFTETSSLSVAQDSLKEIPSLETPTGIQSSPEPVLVSPMLVTEEEIEEMKNEPTLKEDINISGDADGVNGSDEVAAPKIETETSEDSRETLTTEETDVLTPLSGEDQPIEKNESEGEPALSGDVPENQEEDISSVQASPVEHPSLDTIEASKELTPPEKIVEMQENVTSTEIVKPDKSTKKKQLSADKKEKIIEITNNVRTLIARGHIDEARSLIVSGLSLEKNNRDLNLLMANLYEREHAFEKAEFILKELAEADHEDVEVLHHLATVLAMQRKFEVSYELYKKILSIAGETEEVLYTLAHIAAELSLTEDIYVYAKAYLKQYPKNPEILWLYSQSQIKKADRKGAIETLIKLKNLTPYNQEIVDLISKLVTEDELAGNFSDSSEK